MAEEVAALQASGLWPSAVGTRLTVQISVRVQTDGSTGDVRLEESSGYTDIDRSALQIARRAQFAPAIGLDGEPIEVSARFPLTFDPR